MLIKNKCILIFPICANWLGPHHTEGNACISYMLAIQIQGQILNYFLMQNSQVVD